MTELYAAYTYGLDPNDWLKSSEAMAILTSPIRPTIHASLQAAQAYVALILNERAEDFEDEINMTLEWNQLDDQTYTVTLPCVAGWSPEVWWVEKVEVGVRKWK